MVTRVPSRHDYSDLYGSEDDGLYHQLRYAPVWLRTLGTQYRLLKRVTMDISAMYDGSSCERVWASNIIPLLRIVWED